MVTLTAAVASTTLPLSNVGPVLSGRDEDVGIHHIWEVADHGLHVVHQILKLGVAPLLVGGEAAQVLHVVVARLVQVCHQDTGLQRRLLSGGHHDGVPVFHLIIRDALIAQERQDVGRLRIAHLSDQHGVILLVQRQSDGGGHDQDHQNSGNGDPYLSGNLFQALLRLPKERLCLFLHVVQPLSPPSLAAPRRPVEHV